jgi:uncharacterized SAM-binding protein YcdF (DUF218 family)
VKREKALFLKYIVYLVIYLILIGSLLYMIREPVLLAIGNFLIVQDPLQPADVIHVISGLDHRTNYAIQLYEGGYGEYLFFTGGWCPEIQGVHAERSTQLSLEQGVPVSVIRSDSYPVTSTYQEAERLKLWIDQSQTAIQSVIIVSDPHHMRRARWAYRRVLGKNVKLIMAPVPFDQTSFRQQWWTDKASRSMVREEYLKTIYYYARYKFSWGPLRKWLASLDTE